MSGDVLTRAINTADLERLQTVLINICQESEVSKALVSKQLLTETSDSDESTTKNQKESAPPRGKKRPRYAVCSLCREEFDVTQNSKTACKYHDEELEPTDDDFWADHDEDCHGPIDDEENKVNFPEGFVWSCCEGQADSEGCKTGWHEEKTNSGRRL
ncbi:uncharacterized protein J3D65DRAFT_626472 [Phyllosticta citribraziliensis]|uniref:C2H2-type domain-containing protein n=1 Tax=Phyllosticta citribraziliensis TaxID=989973 RepID=A0ABR1LM86_9PEZI